MQTLEIAYLILFVGFLVLLAHQIAVEREVRRLRKTLDTIYTAVIGEIVNPDE